MTFVLGALLLFDPAGPAYQVSLPVAIGIAGTVGLLMAFGVGKAAQARRRTPEVGLHRLIGDVGRVRRTGSSPSPASSGRRGAGDDSPARRPATRSRVERVDEESSRLS